MNSSIEVVILSILKNLNHLLFLKDFLKPLYLGSSQRTSKIAELKLDILNKSK